MSEVKRGYVRPLDIKNGRIDLSHGSGGRAMAQLIEELFAAAFDMEAVRTVEEVSHLELRSIRDGLLELRAGRL